MKEVNIEQGYIILLSAILPGDVVLYHTLGFSPVSWGIRRLICSFWNHAALYIGNGFVVEAGGRGVVKTLLQDDINSGKYIFKVVRLREDAFKDKIEYDLGILCAIGRAISHIGKKYDFKAVAWLGIVYVSKGLLKGWKGNPWQGRNEVFCSEEVCEDYSGTSSIIMHLFAGIHNPGAGCYEITPKDIGKAVSVQYVAGKNVK